MTNAPRHRIARVARARAPASMVCVAVVLAAIASGACRSSASDAAADASIDAGCVIPSMIELYPGDAIPVLTSGRPAAPACVAASHDVIIVLGCPNDDDGAPSLCQKARADIAVSVMKAGFATRFITSGAAAHNAWVEAETLKTLLVARGVAEADVYTEPRAFHTDENIYYSTKIMEAHAWSTAVVVSDAAGHLVMNATCDSNCCVDLGRLTVFDFTLPGEAAPRALGHYVLFAAGAAPVTKEECDHIEQPSKLMCIPLASRRACRDRLALPPEDGGVDASANDADANANDAAEQ